MTKKQKPTKVKPEELAAIFREIVEKERTQKVKHKQKFTDVLNKVKRVMTIPLIIGFIAAFLMYHYFGWDKLIHSLLSWTIGLTILATIITVLSKLNSSVL